MATDAEMIEHFRSRVEAGQINLATAKDDFRQLREYLQYTLDFTSGAKSTKKAALSHSGCSVCASWSG